MSDLQAQKEEARRNRISQQEAPTKYNMCKALHSNFMYLTCGGDLISKELAFENGFIAIYHDFPDFYKSDFIRSLPVFKDNDQQIKKAKLKDFYKNSELVRKIVGDEPKKQDELLNCIRSTVNGVRNTVQRLYSNYEFTGYENHSLRLVETFPEGLHVDSYLGQNDDEVRLRVFINMDNVPRVWRTGLKASALFRTYKSAIGDYDKLHPNDINAAINICLAEETIHAAHELFFAPYAVWVCDSQLVSHEIVYGRKGWAFTFGVKASSLNDPQKAFQARMRAIAAQKE